MESISYTINESKISIDGDSHVGYGITAVCNLCEQLKLEHISADRQFVERLVSKLNENRLDIIHFFDVVEDAISFTEFLDTAV